MKNLFKNKLRQGQLTQLNKLYLHDNKIENIDVKPFETCTNLTEL